MELLKQLPCCSSQPQVLFPSKGAELCEGVMGSQQSDTFNKHGAAERPHTGFNCSCSNGQSGLKFPAGRVQVFRAEPQETLNDLPSDSVWTFRHNQDQS